MFVARIQLAGASSGWAGCFLEVNGLQALQDQLVIGRFSFCWGAGRGKGYKGVQKVFQRRSRRLPRSSVAPGFLAPMSTEAPPVHGEDAVAEIQLAGASSGWAGCFLEVNGLQALQDQLVIGRFSFV